jgi:hypothetical protein
MTPLLTVPRLNSSYFSLQFPALSLGLIKSHILNNPFCNNLSHNLSLPLGLDTLLYTFNYRPKNQWVPLKGQPLGHISESWNFWHSSLSYNYKVKDTIALKRLESRMAVRKFSRETPSSFYIQLWKKKQKDISMKIK